MGQPDRRGRQRIRPNPLRSDQWWRDSLAKPAPSAITVPPSLPASLWPRALSSRSRLRIAANLPLSPPASPKHSVNKFFDAIVGVTRRPTWSVLCGFRNHLIVSPSSSPNLRPSHLVVGAWISIV